jgi:hypothetical protein
LKSTIRADLTETEIRYDLDVQAYNDLRQENCSCPRLLVLLMLPADENRWLSQTSEELTVRHCAYWISLKGSQATTATSSVRIAIPLANVFSVDALTRLLQRAAERRDP